jgi:hypothetical protein
MIYKRKAKRDGKLLVTFEIPGSVWAERILLAGEFSEGERENLPLM